MSATRLKIFISSSQKEFATVRRDLKAFLLNDAFLKNFVAEVFLFEELPARDQQPDQAYLTEVENCNIYLGIFGDQYGQADKSGFSPTEREYRHATKHGKTRLIYLWGNDDSRREPGMKSLIRRANDELIRRRATDQTSLNAEVYASLGDYLKRHHAFRVPPFDATACANATVADLSRKRIDWFIERARRERGFVLKSGTTTPALLTHLKLIEDRKPTNAAILLFGADPQRFHRPAEIKCVSCHGTEYRRPFASQQIYDGDLFALADQALDFVLGKINRAVGTRESSITAPATYELPPDAIGEAIVNAIAHRDYHSNASVEVRLFADRLEVWNPGTLPDNLTLASLRTDHPSVPANPLIADPFYLAHYVEKAGSGTQRMIELCVEAGLPEPTYEIRNGSFVLTLWRDWLTNEKLDAFALNERERQVIRFLKTRGTINNSQYQEEFSVAKRTASIDLSKLCKEGLIVRLGSTGKGVRYCLSKGAPKGHKGQSDVWDIPSAICHEPVTNPPNPPKFRRAASWKRAKNAPNAPFN